MLSIHSLDSVVSNVLGHNYIVQTFQFWHFRWEKCYNFQAKLTPLFDRILASEQYPEGESGTLLI